VLSLPLSCFRWVLRQLNGRTVPDAPGRAPSRMWGKPFRYLSAISEAQSGFGYVGHLAVALWQIRINVSVFVCALNCEE